MMSNYCFKKVSRFKDVEFEMPKRATKESAGYDFVVAEEVVIPSYYSLFHQMEALNYTTPIMAHPIDLNDMASTITKPMQAKPTLVSTGVKAYLPPNTYLQLSMRSSLPLKNWLILANGVGVIDADYVDNPDNEGEIFFQLINLSPFNIVLHKGDKIGQGIIIPYGLMDNDNTNAIRIGGFGSTTF